MKKSKRRHAGGGAASIRALANFLGRSHQAVWKWVRDPRWTFGAGPWDAGTVEQIRAWAAANLSPDPAALAGQVTAKNGKDGLPTDKPSLAKMKLTVERAKSVEQRRKIDADKHDILMKQYHRVDECTAKQVRKVIAIRDAFVSLADGLPFAEEIKSVVRQRVMEILKRFAEGK